MSSTDPLDQIDSLLGDVLASGWGDEPAAPPQVEPEYPPLPTRNADWGKSAIDTPEHKAEQKRRNRKAASLAGALLGVDGAPAFPVDKAHALALAKEAMDEAGIEYKDGGDTPDETDEEPRGALMNIGLLTDLATGRKSAMDVAAAAGITPAQVQTQLATALRDVDPKEIAKALTIQAGEQQLKSGALYGVVLQELVTVMMRNGLSPSLMIELAKLLANVGKIMPKEDKAVATGSGFVLNISMGAAPAQPITIEAE